MQFNENLINNQDPHRQIENDETEYPYESDSEEETNKTSALPNFMPQILPDDEIAKGINSLNSKQREVFNVVHAWAKDYVKYDGYNVEPIQIFLLGSGGTSKSHLVKVVYNVISKTLLYHCKDREKAKSSFTWAYSNISSKYRWNHYSFWSWNKSGIKLLGLNDKSIAALRNRLLEVNF